MALQNNGLITNHDQKTRCAWCGDDPEYIRYHDQEWGVPITDDRALFEKLCLEGFQSGLSWITILRKRESFRQAFANFDMHALLEFTEKDIQTCLTNKNIIRHRGKIEAVINNAPLALNIIHDYGSLHSFFKMHIPKNRPKTFTYANLAPITKTPETENLAKLLKKQGWKFVGPTTLYAFMQSTGFVNDHIEGCYKRMVSCKL